MVESECILFGEVFKVRGLFMVCGRGLGFEIYYSWFFWLSFIFGYRRFFREIDRVEAGARVMS